MKNQNIKNKIRKTRQIRKNHEKQAEQSEKP